MLTGDQVLAARTRAGLTQQQLADQIGVTLRSVGNWERAERVPRGAEQRLRAALSTYLDDAAPAGIELGDVSDARLLAEIARRFDRGREDVGNDDGSAATSQAPVSGATITELPSTEALDPTMPDDVAARSQPGKGHAHEERQRQDEEGRHSAYGVPALRLDGQYSRI